MPQETIPEKRNDQPRDEMMRQPETRPISHGQFVAEVKGIYAGLVMVETKCIEVDNAQSSNTDANSKLNNEQWQALIALHRALLHEHYDFFLASQHPSASPALRRLASKYAMPARMWRHGIHSFLELLRHRLPASLEHMLTFLYLAYSMMALLYETVPAFEDTWIECLGDLARYRMAIEDDDTTDRELWTGLSRHWYCKASDRSPTTGRLYHHLAILARPNPLRQLYYYTKSLCVPIPFSSARESLTNVFNCALSNSPDDTFIRAHKILFSTQSEYGVRISENSRIEFLELARHFNNQLDSHIAEMKGEWLEPGCQIANILCCSLLGYGTEHNVLIQAMSEEIEKADKISDNINISDVIPREKFDLALTFAVETIQIVLSHKGDTNTLPFLHVILVFIDYMRRHPTAMIYLEKRFPWESLVAFLNTLLVSLNQGHTREDEFPITYSATPLPEEFAMRGLHHSRDYLSSNYFDNLDLDENTRRIEHPWMAARRANQILGLARVIADSGRLLRWDPKHRHFSASTEFLHQSIPVVRNVDWLGPRQLCQLSPGSLPLAVV
ncbi:hypothetical protein FOQG_14661 [Fusarium oxysporum f. sp. raphani 54005]|uniref:DNA/RNA-binding domain-containing protein n=2 Tax=Fusarium oxysporum TaxID=5507 RepID=X0BQY2_FUSOX|nr:hypothetical protein FOMG_17999 [Fusarium oxysporum f. sp. melonis 26406]EXK80889.1 hypothetical protein FOQG_14661 [Fusarium oxysporum f. sp. raphani 54005]